MPSIAPIILGKALATLNPIITSCALLPSGQVINKGDNLVIAFDTLLTALNAVPLPTLNFSLIDLQIIKLLRKYNLKIKKKNSSLKIFKEFNRSHTDMNLVLPFSIWQ